MILWAMSFAEWRCAGCRNEVRWVDACVEQDADGRLVAVWHQECRD